MFIPEIGKIIELAFETMQVRKNEDIKFGNRKIVS